MYGRLFGSTNTFTPCDSNTISSPDCSSTYSSLYARPEQPVVRTPKRRPIPLPRRSIYRLTCLAAFSVRVIAIIRSPCLPSAGRLQALGRFFRLLAVLGHDLLHGSLDRVFRQDRAVDLHRRQSQLFCNLCFFVCF